MVAQLSTPDFVMAQEASPLLDGMKATVRTTKKNQIEQFYSRSENHIPIKMRI